MSAKKNSIQKEKEPKGIKCLVWDLDNTLWQGTLLEDKDVFLKAEGVQVIQTLDQRGILQSIASKNDYATTMAKLKEFGIDDYFLYPQITWNSKVSSIQTIAGLLNIGLDTFAFIDDQDFERAEVSFSLPEVTCIDAAQLSAITAMPQMNPRFITEDSRHRRLMYISDMKRNQEEEGYVGPKEEFLATLGMDFTIAPVTEDDLQRAEELTMRTHQLNTTGYSYSYDELNVLRQSDHHILFITSLEDRFGSYGKIGLALLECDEQAWTIKLLLMSCRVMSKGVGTILLNHIMDLAKKAHKRLRAEFISNERNRMMYITYKFAGFHEVEKNGNVSILENELNQIQAFPAYVKVNIIPDYALDDSSRMRPNKIRFSQP